MLVCHSRYIKVDSRLLELKHAVFIDTWVRHQRVEKISHDAENQVLSSKKAASWDTPSFFLKSFFYIEAELTFSQKLSLKVELPSKN